MDFDHHKLYQDFQEAYPLEKLPEMTLEQYTDLKRNNAFSYWVESRTKNLGSIKGGNSYKFGIYEYQNTPPYNRGMYRHDDKYTWYANLGDNRDEVFNKIKARIIKVANAARSGDLKTIEEEKGLGESYKWKIAFLYSNENIVPIYNREWLINIANYLGANFSSSTPTSDIQEFLLSKRDGKDIHVYGDELWRLRQAATPANTIDKDVNYWLYAPGYQASEWQRCLQDSIMCLGWDELGDFRQYENPEEIMKALQVHEGNESSQKNSVLAVRDFLHSIKEGDVIFVKKGRSKIIGQGIVKGDYEYDETAERFHSIRKVRWIEAGEWDAPKSLPTKTLTNISKYESLVSEIESNFKNSEEEENATQTDVNFWWLVASPTTWKFSDIKEGETQEYTLKNENGNYRIKRINFEQAKEGDIVVGYQSNPDKKIVALLTVDRASNGKDIIFRKIIDLKAPVSWFDFKDLPALEDMEFLQNPNGTFFKLTKEEFATVFEFIKQNPFNSDISLDSLLKSKIYTEQDFLKEVFLSADELEKLKSLLKHKKNLILQGAPGVGKTFAAKRLAYVMMGRKDDSRVEQVQFHQNFSYENFIMGYKPTKDGGFKLENGKFFEFCKKAETDPERDYFFIIDEINRGNLSKIFGELLMLIEKGYREKPIHLAYNKEKFHVPSNLFIIGMMNTADRSLALIDYALRRRFAFYPMKPGLDKESFKNEIAKTDDERVGKVVDAVKKLNEEIAKDDSLGEGFCIGHSYFCNPDSDPAWIENIVKYEINPMLEEYWFDNKEKAEDEKKKLLDLL